VPTAELIKPKTYNTLGRIWKQGEQVEVTDEVAAELAANPRFLVHGPPAPVKIIKQLGKPAGQALHEAIRAAADQLDVDNEEHFTVDGKPEVHTLEVALGYTLTAAERDAAYGLKQAKAPIKIKKGTPAPAEPKSETVSHLTEAPETSASDPTTRNAIELN